MTVRSEIDELILLAQSAPSDATEIVGAEGDRFRIEWLKSPAGGFRLTELTHARTPVPRSITWIPPTLDRPATYRQSLPFASGLVSTIVEQGDFMWVQWSLPDVDPTEVVASALTAIAASPEDEQHRQRVAAFQGMQPDTVTRQRLDERLAALITSARGSGWMVHSDESTELPFSMRKVVLTRDGRRRELARGEIFGLPTITLH
jgi:hypothetical protein